MMMFLANFLLSAITLVASSHWWEQLPTVRLRLLPHSKPLGHGKYGTVYKALLDGHRPVAVKHVRCSLVHHMDSESELHRLCSEQHNIVRLLHFERSGIEGVFVMEFVGELNLDSIYNEYEDGRVPLRVDNNSVNRLARVQYIGQCLCKAVLHMHRNLVLHRDISPKNVLVSHLGHVKLCDFGLANRVRFPGQTFSDRAGTPLYSSPRVFNKKEYSFSIDYYSVGMVMWMVDQLMEPFTPIGIKTEFQLTRFHNSKGRSVIDMIEDEGMPDVVKEALQVLCVDEQGNPDSIQRLALFKSVDWGSCDNFLPQSVLDEVRRAYERIPFQVL